MPNPSKIFYGYRALGFVSNHVPLSLRYILRRKENLVVTVVGKSFHTYGCNKFMLLSVSNPHPDDIECLTSDSFLVFTGCKNVIYAWRRGTELKHTYKGHEHNVHLLLPFGPHLLSVDENNTFIVWDIKSEEIVLELPFDSTTFCITALLHPSTYLNKILLGSKQGRLQLWNLKTNKLIYTFNGWGEPVTVLEQAPAIDVAAIGLANGDIYIHNLKFNETIMKFSQEWGPITTISFRTDGTPLMASGSPVGHIAVWDLEKKRLHSEIRDAHRSSVCGMKFLPNEPLLVTSSPDNTLKMWIFDASDGSGRLLKLREGHSGPPLKIRFHGSSGKNILSAGLDSTLRSFSTAADNLNKNLGQASYNRKVAKKKGIMHDPGKMPPIIDFTSETTREKEWDNIAACHRNLGVVTTWTFDNCRMGEHKLFHERFKGDKNIFARCVMLSACGNFVFIGYSTGHVDKYNIQSGIFRGTLGTEKAHDGSVRGLVADALNQIVVSGGSDKELKFWKFRDGSFITSLTVERSIAHMINHRESSMIAAALDDFSVVIIDQDTRRIVRNFEEHAGRICDMTFSPDSRWLIVSSMDSCVKTWDLPTGRLLDCFKVSPVCTSLSMSPTGDYLATIHAGEIGIYLWCNATLYSYVCLQPLPSNYEPQVMDLPVISLEGKHIETEESEDVIEEMEEDNVPEFKSPEQIADQLVTLSLMPHSHWQNLLNLDVIKKRNKPQEPPNKPKNAPFFLPVVSGLKPSFLIEETKNQDDSNKISQGLLDLQQKSTFCGCLSKFDQTGDHTVVINALKSMSPSLIDVEVRCLAPENGGSVFLMLCFLKAINKALKTHKDFDVVVSYLALFLHIHGEKIISEEELRSYLEEIDISDNEAFQQKLDLCICLVKYLRSAVF